MFPVQYACFRAQGRSLDVVIACDEEQRDGRESRIAFALHHGGPEARPYGTDGFFHGVAIPGVSPFRPGVGWRLGVRPDRMEGSRPWLVFVPDMQTLDGRNHAAKMERMVIPDAAELTTRLGTTPVSAAQGEVNISIHQHYILAERVGVAWVLWVPISPVKEFWKDGRMLEKGIPFYPRDAVRLSTADYLQLAAAAGQEPNLTMAAPAAY